MRGSRRGAGEKCRATCGTKRISAGDCRRPACRCLPDTAGRTLSPASSSPVPPPHRARCSCAPGGFCLRQVDCCEGLYCDYDNRCRGVGWVQEPLAGRPFDSLNTMSVLCFKQTIDATRLGGCMRPFQTLPPSPPLPTGASAQAAAAVRWASPAPPPPTAATRLHARAGAAPCPACQPVSAGGAGWVMGRTSNGEAAAPHPPLTSPQCAPLHPPMPSSPPLHLPIPPLLPPHPPISLPGELCYDAADCCDGRSCGLRTDGEQYVCA